MPIERDEASADDLIGGKPPLGKDIEHFPPDIAGGADDGDLETHIRFSSGRRAGYPLRCGP